MSSVKREVAGGRVDLVVTWQHMPKPKIVRDGGENEARFCNSFLFSKL